MRHYTWLVTSKKAKVFNHLRVNAFEGHISHPSLKLLCGSFETTIGI